MKKYLYLIIILGLFFSSCYIQNEDVTKNKIPQIISKTVIIPNEGKITIFFDADDAGYMIKAYSIDNPKYQYLVGLSFSNIYDYGLKKGWGFSDKLIGIKK